MRIDANKVFFDVESSEELKRAIHRQVSIPTGTFIPGQKVAWWREQA
jgi:hypothetical protein